MEKSNFYKIFPKEPDYIEEHKDVPLLKEFLPWNGWVFRGQRKETYKLQTSFERLCYNGLQSTDNLFRKEMGLLREFQRKIRTYRPDIASIDINDLYEYMALMQHYGGATRFLDVSFSFFVALFFATWHAGFNTPYTDGSAGKWTSEDVRKTGRALECQCLTLPSPFTPPPAGSPHQPTNRKPRGKETH